MMKLIIAFCNLQKPLKTHGMLACRCNGARWNS